MGGVELEGVGGGGGGVLLDGTGRDGGEATGRTMRAGCYPTWRGPECVHNICVLDGSHNGTEVRQVEGGWQGSGVTTQEEKLPQTLLLLLLLPENHIPLKSRSWTLDILIISVFPR